MAIHYFGEENWKGGGVVLYVRNTLQYRLNSKIKADNKTKTLWVDIKKDTRP